MEERPIIFSAPMVRAILEGRKTQTRRIVKDNPVDIVTLIGADDKPTGEYGLCFHPSVIERRVSCPYGQPGDRLWVRETHGIDEPTGCTIYRATHEGDEPLNGWKPSIHMPRRASRIDLEITGVRVERLQEISHRDALAEGVGYDLSKPDGAPLPQFERLWESIHGPDSWAANPWVWVVEFKRISP